jgi:diacylglycerol kinase
MINFFISQYKRVLHPLRGLRFALLFDRSFQSQVIGGAIVLILYTFLFSPFTQVEVFFLALAWILMLITELQNTSFEEALNKLHPELHESIGRSKDMAAGAVLLAGFFFVFVLTVVALA